MFWMIASYDGCVHDCCLMSGGDDSWSEHVPRSGSQRDWTAEASHQDLWGEHRAEIRVWTVQERHSAPQGQSAAALLQSRMLHKNALLNVCSRDVEFCALVYVVVVVGAHWRSAKVHRNPERGKTSTWDYEVKFKVAGFAWVIRVIAVRQLQTSEFCDYFVQTSQQKLICSDQMNWYTSILVFISCFITLISDQLI